MRPFGVQGLNGISKARSVLQFLSAGDPFIAQDGNQLVSIGFAPGSDGRLLNVNPNPSSTWVAVLTLT